MQQNFERGFDPPPPALLVAVGFPYQPCHIVQQFPTLCNLLGDGEGVPKSFLKENKLALK